MDLIDGIYYIYIYSHTREKKNNDIHIRIYHVNLCKTLEKTAKLSILTYRVYSPRKTI